MICYEAEAEMKRTFLLVSLICLVISSCANWNTARKVENNVFSAPAWFVWAKVSPEFTYIGRIGDLSYVLTTVPEENETFIFGKINNLNIIEEGVIIRISELRGPSAYWLPDLFSNMQYRLISDNVDVQSYRYQHAIGVSDYIFYNYEEKFLKDKGYIIPNQFMTERLARKEGIRTDNKRIIILYFRDLNKVSKVYPFNTWLDSGTEQLTDDQIGILNEFRKGCKDKLCILNSPPLKKD
jgi:hypothetical protein